MPNPLKLSKSDVRKAMIRHQFAPCANEMEAFRRLRSIQFDPIAPAGCNHDLVLQARVPGYKVGDWEKLAYVDRLIYDGWDKQACLVPFEGWPWRRIFHDWHRPNFKKIFEGHPHAVEAVLAELETRGPLATKEFEFKERKADWEGSWFGPNVAKVTLRALWHTGQIMTVGRRRGHHVYDLADRVVPEHIRSVPALSEEEAIRELVLERYRAMGIIKPTAPYEVWSYRVYAPARRVILEQLAQEGVLQAVDVDGMKAYAATDFLKLLDLPSIEPRVVFVAPLDQLLWDRKMIAHLFDFDYAWEIYTPEVKRRWGYYVLPVLFGDELVARIEFYCRKSVLEVRQWHTERPNLSPAFYSALEVALKDFAAYCSATSITVADHIDQKMRDLLQKAL